MTQEERKKREIAMKKRWASPEYRKKMLEKQRSIGYRTYNNTITKLSS